MVLHLSPLTSTGAGHEAAKEGHKEAAKSDSTGPVDTVKASRPHFSCLVFQADVAECVAQEGAKSVSEGAKETADKAERDSAKVRSTIARTLY